MTRSCLEAKGVLSRVADVQEAVLVLVFLVDGTHQGSSSRKDFVDKDEDGLFGRELDSLSDDVDELADGEVLGDRGRSIRIGVSLRYRSRRLSGAQGV